MRCNKKHEPTQNKTHERILLPILRRKTNHAGTVLLVQAGKTITKADTKMQTFTSHGYFTIRRSITGGWLLSMPCPITGRRQDAHIDSSCSIEHISQVARSMTQFATSAQEVAIVASSRMDKALALRASRYRRQSYRQEVFGMLDCGMIPTARQLRRAGMIQ